MRYVIAGVLVVLAAATVKASMGKINAAFNDLKKAVKQESVEECAAATDSLSTQFRELKSLKDDATWQKICNDADSASQAIKKLTDEKKFGDVKNGLRTLDQTCLDCHAKFRD